MAAQAYVFKTRLLGVRGVTRTVAVLGNQQLDHLHDVLQDAHGWANDHLYAFWLTGRFWRDPDQMYSMPFELGPDEKSTEVRVDRLGLELEQKLAYVFDFGDEWRVLLTLAKVEDADAGPYPRVLASRGEAPPQYVYGEEWDEDAA
jgi:hypothetical protein